MHLFGSCPPCRSWMQQGSPLLGRARLSVGTLSSIRILGLLAALGCAACGPSWKDVSRTLADDAAPGREPIRDRQRTYYDSAATQPRTELGLLLYPDGRSLKDGIERRWAADGTLQLERGWRAGEPDGWWREWWPGGAPRFEYFYDRSEPTLMRWWHQAGACSSQGAARNGLREGLWRGRHPGGAPAFEGRYVNGRRDGPWVFWHPDGSLAERGSFLHGTRVGTWETYEEGEMPAAAPQWNASDVPTGAGA